MGNFLKDMRIATRITFLVALILSLMVLMSEFGLRQLDVIGREVKAVTGGTIPLIESLNKIALRHSEQIVYFERAVEIGKQMEHDKALREDFEAAKDAFDNSGIIVEREIEEGKKLIELIYEKSKNTDKFNTILQVDYELSGMSKEYNDYYFQCVRVLNLLSMDKFEDADVAAQKLGEERTELDKVLDSFSKETTCFIADSVVRMRKSQQNAMIGTALFSAFILLFGLGVGIFIARSICKPLNNALDIAHRIAEGERNVEIETTGKNETGQLLATMKDMARSVSKAEEDLKHAYEGLESTNKELKEMQSQLVQNEKLASIGQLAAGVAHEMNTPVGFVASNFQTLESYVTKFKSLIEMYGDLIGQIDTLGKAELTKKADDISKSWDDMKINFILKDIQQVFNESKEGLDRVTSIIKNLKDFSRIDQAEEFDEFDLNSGINSTLVVARNEIKYDADLKTDFTELPHIFCHTGQINQVFLNIIINAAQAIKAQEREDKGTITVKTYATETHVVCEISDNGPGIEPDKLSKIFDPFFTTKPAGKGTGLGLSVSHDIIVSKHKGELLVDSTVGEVTTFTIKLPIKTSKQNNRKETVRNGKEDSIIC